MKFLSGSKKEFLDFLEGISQKDRVAILSHNDLDGIASAVFLEEILKSKGIRHSLKKFLDYKNGMFMEITHELDKKNINKIFILDIAADQTDSKGFEKLRKKFDVFLIDHHPMNPRLRNKQRILKTESSDCASFIIYELGDNLFDRKKWAWLISSAMISDMSYKKRENLEFIKRLCPDITSKDIFDSYPGKIENIISFALIYYKSKNLNLNKVYLKIKNKKIRELSRYSGVIKKEINKNLSNFRKKSEFYPEKKIYFFTFNSKFDIGAILSTLISLEDDKGIFIITRNSGEFITIHARNQSKNEDMGKLLKKGIEGLKNSNAGGHAAAAGGRIMKKDFKKFKENILNF
jgi:single-stranded DNA-specific DHH superfamily exonuclease